MEKNTSYIYGHVETVIFSGQACVLTVFNTYPLVAGEPKSRIVQKHTFFAPERYTTGILYTDSLNSA